jgi:hypothetical protein
MYVTVSLNIELDATDSLTQMGRQIQEVGLSSGETSSQASDPPARRIETALTLVRKRSLPNPRNETTCVTDALRTGGSASQVLRCPPL